MSYVRGENRGQAALLPAAIEDYVAEDAPVRVAGAFVDGLLRPRLLSVRLRAFLRQFSTAWIFLSSVSS